MNPIETLSRWQMSWSTTSFLRKLMLIILFVALAFFAKGIYMPAKALFAQQLLNFAWARHLQDGELHRPWPWADSDPLAQLQMAGQDPLIILAGATGNNLAFAPAWMITSSPFNRNGNSVLFGHNDTHFNILKEAQIDDEILLTTYADTLLTYQVIETKIVSENELSVIQDNGQERLTLITCYPFDSNIVHSDLRFVVVAKRIKNNSFVHNNSGYGGA